MTQTAIDQSCSLCHNTTGPGAGPRPGAPSCFSANFTNANGIFTSCHPGGPGVLPHPLGAEWLAPSAHGAQAKKDLSFCQSCHAVPPSGNDPSFNLPMADHPMGCATCHPAAEAHPTDWQGSGTASHRTAQDLQACEVYHDVVQGRTGPNPDAPSCFSSEFTNADGQTRPCHSGGPGTAPHPVGDAWLAPEAHGANAKKDLTFCQACHATPSTGGPTRSSTCRWIASPTAAKPAIPMPELIRRTGRAPI